MVATCAVVRVHGMVRRMVRRMVQLLVGHANASSSNQPPEAWNTGRVKDMGDLIHHSSSMTMGMAAVVFLDQLTR